MSGYRGMLIGYARQSTTEQKAGLEAQVRELEALGCDRVYIEEASAVDSKRPELRKAIDHARDGDVLVVTNLSRLARSVANLVDIQRELAAKGKGKGEGGRDSDGVALRILNMNLDTGTPTGKLMVNLISRINQFERELMLERQIVGIAKAKGEGKYKGRAPTALRKAKEIKAMRAEGKTVPEIVAALKVSRASVFRMLKDQPAEAA